MVPIPSNSHEQISLGLRNLRFTYVPSFISSYCILTSPYVRLRNLLSPLLLDCVRFDV